ncbi:MAG: hypothetical protein U1E39_10825 [Planctomycetota bacterium]
MRRDVCGWCGCALRPRDQRVDRAAVVCRTCGASMLVTADADVAVLQATVRVHGTARGLRIAPAWSGRLGWLRRGLALFGVAIVAALLVAFAASFRSWGLVPILYVLWLARRTVPSVVLTTFGGPFRTLRFGRGGLRRGRRTTPEIVRAVLVETSPLTSPYPASRWRRVMVVDARWRRRTVAWLPPGPPEAAVVLARAIHRAVVGDVPAGVPIEVDGVASRATEAGG